MPENEFEKKVSSEMHELKFKPSEQVWEKVEERIRKKKDRRIFIIIFLFAGLALLGYWQWNNLFGEKKNEIVKTEIDRSNTDTQSKQETQTKKITETRINDKSPLNNETSGLTETQKKSTDNRQPEINNKSSDKKEEKVTEEKLSQPNKNEKTSALNNKTGQNKTEKKQKRSNSNVITKTQKEQIAVASSKNRTPDVRVNDEKEIKQDQVIQEQTKQEPKKQEGTKVKASENKLDSVNKEMVEQKSVAETKKDTVSKKEPVKDSAAAVIQKNPSHKKWKWGLQVTPGVSSLNDQTFSLGTEKSADMAFSSPVNSGGAPSPPPASPSDHKAGFAFKLGGFMQGQISKKSQLVFGLQYAYYSEKINVGNQIGTQTLSYTANLNYTAAAPYQMVTNRYHFIEAAANYQLRLNKNPEKPFTWNVGFNIGQLFATNALMYDTASGGIYHKNNDYINKTQFSLSTGFSWTVMNNQRMQWTLGPTVDIHLNSLLDNPFENKKFLFFAGLRSAFIFNNKK